MSYDEEWPLELPEDRDWLWDKDILDDENRRWLDEHPDEEDVPF